MNVLIAGAGPTGLTLAHSLKRQGISYRLIDKAAERSPWSRALGIQARALEVLERIGLAEQVLGVSKPLLGSRFHLPSRTVSLNFTNVHPRYPSMAILPQTQIEEMLERSGAVPERRVEFIGLEGDRARLRHADGHEELYAADWIVGCDGAHSAVRQAAGIDFPGKRYDMRLLLTDCRLDGLEPGYMHVTLDPPLLCFAMPNGLWRMVTVLPPDAPMLEEGSMEPFRRPGIEPRDPMWWNAFGINQRQVPIMVKGRIVLAGDASHIHSPAGGQGMNIGIQDAWSLGSALAQGQSAVEAWARKRHAVARRVLKETDRTTKTMVPSSKPMMALRGLLIRLAAKSPMLVRKLESDIAGMSYPAIVD